MAHPSQNDNDYATFRATVSYDVSRMELELPLSACSSEASMKEWIWEHHKEALLQRLNVTAIHDKKRQRDESTTTAVEPRKNSVSDCPQKRLDMLDTISKVQRQFFQSESPSVVFGGLLEALLELMESEYGFIGEIRYEEDGTMYLQTHAITNIAWNETTRQFYEDNRDSGLKFYNLNSLFGTVMTTKEAVISNFPQGDPRACGIPEGHPPLNHFLGIPFFKDGTVMNGMVGISNRQGGYLESDVAFLEPFTVTCSNLIQAYWQKEQNLYLINTLEEKVKERTRELELANESLAEANRRIIQTSQQQLQHFASMSHEIRTPLNAVIGCSDLLLQQTQLTPMLKESVRMIATSGDLLLSVVNDVLDYSKLESGNFEMTVTKSNLQTTLSNVFHSIDMKKKSSQQIRAFYHLQVPEMIHMDSRRLQQILFNLLGNAVKFSPEDGVIEFSVKVVDAPLDGSSTRSVSSTVLSTFADTTEGEEDHFHRYDTEIEQEQQIIEAEGAQVSQCPFKKSLPTSNRVLYDESCHENEHEHALGSEGSKLEMSPRPFQDDAKIKPRGNETKSYCGNRAIRFEVKDYGQGIASKDFESIFQPFHQTRTGKAESVYGGTGLGLAITKKLVLGLQGMISVDSVEGEWAKFTVDLPLVDPSPGTAALSKELESVSVGLVLGSEHKCEEVHALRVLQAYNVDVTSLETVAQLEALILQTGGRPYICLVHESLFSETSFTALESHKSVALVTVGSKYVVNRSDSRHHHLRSLEHMIPFALIKTIVMISKGKSVTESPVKSDLNSTDNAKLRILLAEDNLVNQKVMTRMLTRVGAKNVDVVANGEEAIKYEAAKQYDLILMDMQMPICDGLTATRTICARTAGHPVPKIVFVTAHVSSDFEEECRLAGGKGFLPKPVKVHEIKKCLDDVCRETQERQSVPAGPPAN